MSPPDASQATPDSPLRSDAATRDAAGNPDAPTSDVTARVWDSPAAADALAPDSPSTPDAPNLLEWRSFDVTTRASPTQATVKAASADIVAEVELYESSNNGGVDKAGLFASYHAGSHPESDYKVAGYWEMSANSLAPYAGKSTVGRGSDTGEANAPPPAGVLDLELYPPQNDHLVVAAFVVPVAGTYSVSDLAVRKVATAGTTATLKVFSTAKTPIASLQAPNTPTWVRDSTSRALGALSAGDRIYFAVDRDGLNAGDATEISWTVTRAP